MDFRMRLIWLYLPLVGLAATGVFLAAKYPVAFQKVNSIEVVQEGLACTPPTTQRNFDVEEVIGGIPYAQDPTDVFSILPRVKYEKTIEEGNGNCSNLVFGMSYALLLSGVDFRIVHLMPDDFLLGAGHTVIRVPMERKGKSFVGILDILNAGIPVSTDVPVDLPALRKTPKISIASLNPLRMPQQVYYQPAFLNSTVNGCIDSQQVQIYFSFLDRYYVPIGSERLEKYLYDGLAVFAGAYPSIRVSPQSFETLFGQRMWVYYGFKSALWLFRILALLMPLALFFELIILRRQRQSQYRA